MNLKSCSNELVGLLFIIYEKHLAQLFWWNVKSGVGFHYDPADFAKICNECLTVKERLSGELNEKYITSKGIILPV